ncbi:unnamed protein product [Rotaria magnacalcarata]|uniref:Uncharacterized protein n=1 Tax=Rotaria magnacalcarata TaxID=392030 RepID=A0A814IPC0_9BILA|nr:unnamed protein product [Rotaria magnacalcarata]CAF1411641.1 unnamed protein product [Rotaria magnacalcarata]CAF1942007.1 unnamed protein product [Rotaria magnacalcarata]CAF2072538.1 unnamed protein product [Rotaria magnacalcarata]CAF2078099.1 unnamed protein product [Rotaria magnacalcarata]
MAQTIPEPLAQKPGIQLIKAGSLEMVPLAETYMCAGLNSSIIDVPISNENKPLTMGHFEMRPSPNNFPFYYEYLEVKTVVSGKIIVMDEQKNVYEGHPGDVFIFTPPHVVTFLAESDGRAVYMGHRGPEPSFLPGYQGGPIETPAIIEK